MNKITLTLLVGINSIAIPQAFAETPTIEEMWRTIQVQQAEINQLKDQLADTEEKAEATVNAVESLSTAPVQAGKTTLGGYGELHYNNLESDNSTSSTDAVDFHRFVMFAGHQFSDKVRFFSELEIEHSIAGGGKGIGQNDSKPGEVGLEQAYIEWDLAANQTAKAGLFLLPVGIINETHEPNTFYGTERNNVEKHIIPATWWEAGAAMSGELRQGLSYDMAAHSGLYMAEGNHKPRDGRQKVGKAKADDLAFTGRLKYTAIPGLELAATLQYQSDVRQDEGAAAIDGTLFETHIAWQQDQFQLRALYAQWAFDKAINATKEGADTQKGLYLEPSYRINDKIGVFARYSQWDNTAGSATDSETTQFDLGINYWLHPNVVFKLDYQNQHAAGGTGPDGINIGVGYSY